MTLSASSSLLLSGFVASSYVGGLYIAPSARLSFVKAPEVHRAGDRAQQPSERWRDDPEVIRARLKAALISTCISCGCVYATVALGNEEGRWIKAIRPAIDILGIGFSRIQIRSILPHLLIPLLYTGPLSAQWLSQGLPFQRCWTYQQDLIPMVTTWIGLRNYIIAPITEEIVFRSCLLAIAELSGKTFYQKVFVTPLWFGIAHLHHGYEIYNKFGRSSVALKRALLTCTVQIAYTTLFGAYTSFLFLRTGSVLSPITAHIIANIMGLPQLAGELHAHPKHKLFICTAYFIGLIGFVSALGPWTNVL